MVLRVSIDSDSKLIGMVLLVECLLVTYSILVLLSLGFVYDFTTLIGLFFIDTPFGVFCSNDFGLLIRIGHENTLDEILLITDGAVIGFGRRTQRLLLPINI